MSRFRAARDYLLPLSIDGSRPDVIAALDDADEGANLSSLVQQTFLGLAMWPLLVECHAQAMCRHDYDEAFHDELVETLGRGVLHSGSERDPLPAIAALAGCYVGYAWTCCDEGGLPHDIARRTIQGYGSFTGEGPRAFLQFYAIDPDGTLGDLRHRSLRRIARSFMALRDLPSGREERLVAVAGAFVDLVVLKRMRAVA